METQNSLDLLSKLLANENITVIRERVPTASFDIKNRVLRLPIYANVQPVQEMLLALHEVGHALFTSMTYVDNIKAYDKPKFKSYMNVVEDARIERMMKDRYPGCRRDFFIGYNLFHETNFFGVKDKDVNTLPLIDRINLEFKLGFRAGVKFDAEERKLVRLVTDASTEEDVYTAAKLIYEYAKVNDKKPKENYDEDQFDFGDSDEDEYDYEDTEDDEPTQEEESEEEEQTPESNSPSDDEETEDDEPTQEEESTHSEDDVNDSETQNAFDEHTHAISDTNGKPILNIAMELVGCVNIVDTKTIIAEIAPFYANDHQGYTDFKRENAKIVSYMVKEFEMRKAALASKRTMSAKSGSLSSSKLYQYKIANDIFKKYNIVADATNHGMLMLVDWSGSMTRSLRSVISQIITLTQFCSRVGIKFEVFAFSDHADLTSDTIKRADGSIGTVVLGSTYNLKNDELRKQHLTKIMSTPNSAALVMEGHLSLLKFFNSNMSAREMEIMSYMLYTHTIIKLDKKYKLAATPLVDSLLFLKSYIEVFKTKYNVQKVSVITMTDGVSTRTKIVNQVSAFNIAKFDRFTCFLHNKTTNRYYPLTLPTTYNSIHVMVIQRAILTALSDQYPDVDFVGFFIANDSLRSIARDIGHLYTCDGSSYSGLREMFVRIKKEMQDNSCSEIVFAGYDKFFVVPVVINDGGIDFGNVSSKMSSSQIAKEFSRRSSGAMNRRVLANKFVAQIS